ncbi:MAG: bifunctional 5,10-methylenetetrahydrofolate dehydrogenase/5,10-methenyltetrahydrofolate cyclohydrolase [Patescibacteria group bacterium]|nr:bifunctional 5,10-methylenetetrahydrofolate dehydrogenase/5,10-methenyltetrahydrofolate cyclohydrolase [Patescibacteria group bacterium]
MASIIDGEKLATAKEAVLKQQVPPGLKLAILAFKADRAGQVYSRLKEEAGKRVGIEVARFNYEWQETELIREKILELNADQSWTGIMIQRPGYRGEKFEKEWIQLVNAIVPSKDVDGLRVDSPFVPATVRAVENIPFRNGMTLRSGMKGKKIVIVGRGMVGKKLKERLRGENISSRDKDLAKKTKQAEVLICCSGREKLIKKEMVKLGAMVIDVGWPKGDVDFDEVVKVAGVITPVPGGVGPLTVVCLLENLMEAVYNS